MNIKNLKAAIKAANLTQEHWAKSQGLTSVGASKLVTGGCIVIDGVVYRPTKYKVRENESISF